MNEVQFLLISSSHCEPFHLTMSDVAGGVPPAVTGMEGGGSPPLAETTVSGTMVVWLPDSKTLTCPRPNLSTDAPVKIDAPPETQTKASARPDPANITSVGSSPTSTV